MIKRGVLSNADGSARWNNQVLGAVFGPAEALQKDELIERAAIEVVVTGDASNKTLAPTIRDCVGAVCLATLHPRTAIRIVLQPLKEDEGGALFSALVNAASVALMDAGIQMSAMVIASSVAIMDDGTLVSDPTATQHKSAAVVIDFVWDSSNFDGGIIASRCHHGVFTMDQYNRAMEMSVAECKKKMDLIRQELKSRGPA